MWRRYGDGARSVVYFARTTLVDFLDIDRRYIHRCIGDGLWRATPLEIEAGLFEGYTKLVVFVASRSGDKNKA